MAMAISEIEAMISDALPDAKVEVRDLAGDGEHYAATVVSPAFKGKSRVQQHQLVYAALKGRMGGELHALALTTSAECRRQGSVSPSGLRPDGGGAAARSDLGRTDRRRRARPGKVPPARCRRRNRRGRIRARSPAPTNGATEWR